MVQSAGLAHSIELGSGARVSWVRHSPLEIALLASTREPWLVTLCVSYHLPSNEGSPPE